MAGGVLRLSLTFSEIFSVLFSLLFSYSSSLCILVFMKIRKLNLHKWKKTEFEKESDLGNSFRLFHLKSREYKNKFGRKGNDMISREGMFWMEMFVSRSILILIVPDF